MEKIIEDIDIMLTRMDIMVKEMKDTASDMAELMDVIAVIPENMVEIKGIFKRQCLTIKANAGNYEIESIQIKDLIKGKKRKVDIPSSSSDEQMMT